MKDFREQSSSLNSLPDIHCWHGIETTDRKFTQGFTGGVISLSLPGYSTLPAFFAQPFLSELSSDSVPKTYKFCIAVTATCGENACQADSYAPSPSQGSTKFLPDGSTVRVFMGVNSLFEIIKLESNPSFVSGLRGLKDLTVCTKFNGCNNPQKCTTDGVCDGLFSDACALPNNLGYSSLMCGGVFPRSVNYQPPPGRQLGLSYPGITNPNVQPVFFTNPGPAYVPCYSSFSTNPPAGAPPFWPELQTTALHGNSYCMSFTHVCGDDTVSISNPNPSHSAKMCKEKGAVAGAVVRVYADATTAMHFLGYGKGPSDDDRLTSAWLTDHPTPIMQAMWAYLPQNNGFRNFTGDLIVCDTPGCNSPDTDTCFLEQAYKPLPLCSGSAAASQAVINGAPSPTFNPAGTPTDTFSGEGSPFPCWTGIVTTDRSFTGSPTGGVVSLSLPNYDALPGFRNQPYMTNHRMNKYIPLYELDPVFHFCVAVTAECSTGACRVGNDDSYLPQGSTVRAYIGLKYLEDLNKITSSPSFSTGLEGIRDVVVCASAGCNSPFTDLCTLPDERGSTSLLCGGAAPPALATPLSTTLVGPLPYVWTQPVLFSVPKPAYVRCYSSLTAGATTFAPVMQAAAVDGNSYCVSFTHVCGTASIDSADECEAKGLVAGTAVRVYADATAAMEFLGYNKPISDAPNAPFRDLTSLGLTANPTDIMQAMWASLPSNNAFRTLADDLFVCGEDGCNAPASDACALAPPQEGTISFTK